MLRSLNIRDFVIVDRLELEFGAGFGALTGETGAGKSILVDALGLALGGRADAGVVRAGCGRAEVTACFDAPRAAEFVAWMDEQGFASEDGDILLRRTVDASGRSRAWINGSTATLAQLRKATQWLADIHGQHAHLALLEAQTQRVLVDARAGALALAAEVAARHRQWQECRRQRAAAESAREASARERELIAWQLRELDELDFEAGQWRELNAEHERLAHAAGLIAGAEETLAALGEGDFAVAAVLRSLDARIAALVQIDPALSEVGELLSAAAIQAGEAEHALRRYRERLEIDPQRLAEVEARMAAVIDLARKHRVEPEQLGALGERWRSALEALERNADPARLEAAEAGARAAFEAAAARLSALRRPAAQALSVEITAAMQTLAMAGGRFEVALEACEPSAHGAETIELRVAANPGQALRSLAKVVSGGELSRIGLAIQVLASRESGADTLVFDEVDVGIGGRVAEIVGKLLAQLGERRQVLCVTHLPQVAACAHWQWRVAKIQHGGETVSEVRPLDAAARVEELARMLGGVDITSTTREHAAEMLRRAAAAQGA